MIYFTTYHRGIKFYKIGCLQKLCVYNMIVSIEFL